MDSRPKNSVKGKTRKMDSAEIISTLEPWRLKHRRPAWKPLVEGGDGSETSSKFSGNPWISEEHGWPECRLCGKQMQFFLQLNLNELPQELSMKYGPGLLQLFYCTRDECQGNGGWMPFEDEMSCVRVIQAQGSVRLPNIQEQEVAFPPSRIAGWEPFDDFPSSAEHGELGLEYIYDFKAWTTQVKCDELGLASEPIATQSLAEDIASSQSGDKLAGWPRWIQGVEYPNCPKCGERMVLVLQVDSEDHIPFMFGDTGCGHITQCPTHKDVVAFGWACS
jgi:uncharacterized protein YwqG